VTQLATSKEAVPGAPVALSVLIGEDDQDLAYIYTTYLRHAGHTVRCAVNGAGVLEELAAERPDILFLDLGLPDISGQETLSKLRDLDATRDLPVVIFTNLELDARGAATLAGLAVEAIILKVSMPPPDLAGWLGRWSSGRALPVRHEAREQPPSN
jgi:CheY-like chemotaxis protein